MAFADGTRVRTATDWPRRRAEILAEWHGLMGPWPALLDKVPMEVLSEVRRETYMRRRVRLQAIRNRSQRSGRHAPPQES